MKIYRHAVFPITLRVTLLFSGISIDAIAESSSCGSSNTETTISRNETAPCNLSQGENLTIKKNASIDAPIGLPNRYDPYGRKYNAVNIGADYNQAQVISVDSIKNNGVLQGNNGVSVTYSGSVGQLRNHGTISGTNGAVWVSGQMNMLDNYGSINSGNDTDSLNAIQIQPASGTHDNSQYGRIGTILNQKEGSIDGISVVTSTLKLLHNFGTLKSQQNNSLSTLAAFAIDMGSNVGIFNNDGTVIGPNHGVLVQNGGYLENLYNHSGSKGVTAEQDAIQVTGQGMALLDVNPHIRSSKIKQITNASLLYGKRNGISIDDKGVVDTITNLDGGVIQGDKFSINNQGTLINGIDNAGTIDGDVELGSASLYMSGPNAILKGNVSGTKDSVVTIGSKDGLTKNLNLSFTHNMNAGVVRILSGNALSLGDGHTTGNISSDINNEGRLHFNQNDKTTYSHIISGTGSVHQVGSGTTLLTGANTYIGETKIDSGTLQLGDNGTTGSIDKTSSVTIGQSGVLAFDHNNNITFSNNISGTGGVEHVGKGTTILSGQNTYVGKTNIKSGTLQFNTRNNGPDTHLVAIGSESTLALNLNGTSRFDGVISGKGHLGKVGTGTTTLSSDSSAFTGSTGVEEGTLIIDGKLGTTASAFNVKKGGTVNGSGTIGGTATIENGGHLSGKQGDTLTFGHDLILGHGANVGVSLGAAETSASALFDVRGNLTLAGTLNVTDLGGFSAGEYDIFNYGGTLTNNGIALTGGEPGALSLDTGRGKKVYLTNTGGMLLNYWDGGDASKHNNGAVDGGNGVWQVGGGNNWTSKAGRPNASWNNADQFAIFSGIAGKVQVDNGGDQVTVNGMQFGTEGYTLTGASLVLKNDKTGSAKIRVGTGNKSTAGSAATIESDLTGSATLEATDYGTLVLKGKNDYTGGTKVTRGILQLGDGGTTGSISGDVVTGDKGTLAFNRSDAVRFNGHITGKGNLVQKGDGITILGGHNAYTGKTEVKAGTLQFNTWNTVPDTRLVDIGSKGTLALNLNGTSRFDGVISGKGHLGKIGTGSITLSSDSSAFTGAISVDEGTLIVDGKLGTTASAFNVKKGGTVNGSGTIGGTATIENGGHLSGKQGDTLTFGHDLILGHGANVGVSLGAAETSASALFDVRGNLTLAGTLNVTDLGGFSAGEYDIFHYGGTLINNGMMLTGGKPGVLSLDTGRDKKVYLTNTGGMLLNYWDGGDASKHNNGAVDGGSGVWQVGGGNNWTSKAGRPNASWSNADQFAIFSGTAGKVQVDNDGGQVTVNGMQFGTEGYTLIGAPLVLKNDNTGSAKVRVGTGNKSAAGSAATIESDLTGSATLEATDYGTLVLKGKNDYTGGTKVTQGILQLGDGGTTGSISGDVVTGDKGTLVFNRSDAVRFSGHITGKGNLVQKGGGTTLLTGGNNYTGTTAIQRGTLRQGAKAVFSTASSYTIGQYGTFDMGGFNTKISALSNNGRVLVGGDNQSVGRILTVAGDYSGNNGTVSLSTALAGDNSKTDRLVVNGSTSGTTQLAIKNVGGTGAKTQEGIKVIDVQGSSDGIFNLVGDYHYQGDPAIVAGAYAYRLYKNGTDNSDGNWYLRSSLTRAKPNPEPAQHYQAGVSVYETYGRILQTLNAPESLRDRIGGRQYPLSGINEFKNAEGKDSTGESTNPMPNGVWGRLTASHGKLSPRVTTSGADATTYNLFRAQIGMDKRFYENDQGAVNGGVFLQYSNIDAKVGSVHGEGDIRAKGYTVGVTSTWYGKNQFYLDGLAQVTYFNNDLNSKTASQPLGNNKSALGYALSLEAGQKFDLSPKWSLTPQAQLMFSSVDMNGFHDPFGTRIHFNQSESMKLRVGTTIDYRQKWHDALSKDEKSTHLYGFFNINQEVLGRSDLTDVANVGFISGNDRTWGGVGAGGSYHWGDGKYFIYGETSANTSLNNFADSYDMKAKIGIKRTW